jgi:hypothetical protein
LIFASLFACLRQDSDAFLVNPVKQQLLAFGLKAFQRSIYLSGECFHGSESDYNPNYCGSPFCHHRDHHCGASQEYGFQAQAAALKRAIHPQKSKTQG